MDRIPIRLNSSETSCYNQVQIFATSKLMFALQGVSPTLMLILFSKPNVYVGGTKSKLCFISALKKTPHLIKKISYPYHIAAP